MEESSLKELPMRKDNISDLSVLFIALFIPPVQLFSLCTVKEIPNAMKLLFMKIRTLSNVPVGKPCLAKASVGAVPVVLI
jgi:hypothetical protein